LSKKKLKITGGLLRSRLITFDDITSLRPTKSFIRETIFNTINVKEMTCLDLYAGSGILSAEALSRGAKDSTLVENNPVINNQIVKQYNNLDIDNYSLVSNTVKKFLTDNINTHYDVIFIDPPYETNLLGETLKLLYEYGYFYNNTYLYLEQNKASHDKRLFIDLMRTHILLKDLSIGDVSYTIAKKRA